MQADAKRDSHTRCCVVGGGPAGVMLGLLLARAGVQVTVLEKHGDFLRDFRGDTVHPSTLQILDELGLLSKFAQLPAHRVEHLSGLVGGREQRVQITIQKRLISRVLEQSGEPPRMPALLRFLLRFRAIRHQPARLFGYGLRQEHVRTPELSAEHSR